MNQRYRFLATLDMTVIQNFLNPPVLLLQHFIILTPLQSVISPHIPRHPRSFTRHPRAGGDPEQPPRSPTGFPPARE
ncbi:hypothetical protein [Nitrosomonas sp.]|uniref:hypothetical protein n=1 Tax=Nitrosomonas sp. TaxID=42353 RepID=UPI0025E07269|nr:hypothetical protein [Nitrosomonas sp.]MBY0485133.1 hypothetical protein [Nitrosomonas sp.]